MTNMVDESFGETLRRLLKEKNLSQGELARRAGMEREYISQLVNDKVKSTTLITARKLADGLGVSPSLLLGDTSVPNPTTALSDLEFTIRSFIPVYGEVSAGAGVVADPIDYIACSRARIPPDTWRAFRVKGLCLEPEVQDGDTLIVDTALFPEVGNLVVCIIGDEASVKYYRGDDQGNRWLENHYGKYQPDQVHLVGVVIEYSRKLR